MNADREQTRRDVPPHLCVYYCPICKVGTGDRSWHSLRDGGLFPQTDTEHDCVKINVSDLLAELEQAEERERALVEALKRVAHYPYDVNSEPETELQRIKALASDALAAFEEPGVPS